MGGGRGEGSCGLFFWGYFEVDGRDVLVLVKRHHGVREWERSGLNIIDVGREGRLAGFPTSKILFFWGISSMEQPTRSGEEL